MKTAERTALTAIAVIVAASSLASFAESYRALLDWAGRHGPTQFWVWIWPLQIDAFIAIGELALFIAMRRGWPHRARVTAWVVALTGLAVSVAANMGHETGGWTDRLTWAVPPLAAAASLTVGLAVVKWLQRTAEPELVQEEGHGDRLAAMPSKAERVRYAAEVTGHRDPHHLTTWLAGQGHDIPFETVRTSLRRIHLNGDHHEQTQD